MVVFEDDAVIAVKNVTYALHRELSDMTTDLLFLGWCYGRRFMPMVSICLHFVVKGQKVLLLRTSYFGNNVSLVTGSLLYFLRSAHMLTLSRELAPKKCYRNGMPVAHIPSTDRFLFFMCLFLKNLCFGNVSYGHIFIPRTVDADDETQPIHLAQG